MIDRIEQTLRETVHVHQDLLEQSEQLQQVGLCLAAVLEHGGCIYVMGNGGSAADSQHLAGELVGRFRMERPALPCHALTTDTSVLTAVGNDYGQEQVFVRQVEAFVGASDAVIGITTSGESANVVAAVQEANRRGALTVGLTGADGGALARACRMTIRAPSEETPRVQEAHGTIVHVLCDVIERKLFSEAP